MPKDIIAIKTVINEWVKAIQEKDLAGILRHHAKEILMFDVPLPIQSKGMQQYKKTWELFSKYSPGGKDSFQLKELKVHAGDSIAFCTALIKLSKNKNAECRLTIGLKKIRNTWMIVHEHHSAPHKLK